MQKYNMNKNIRKELGFSIALKYTLYRIKLLKRTKILIRSFHNWKT